LRIEQTEHEKQETDLSEEFAKERDVLWQMPSNYL
jgi:hypothetical protein